MCLEKTAAARARVETNYFLLHFISIVRREESIQIPKHVPMPCFDIKTSLKKNSFFLQNFSKVHKIFEFNNVKVRFASEVPFTKLLTSRNTLANLKDNSDCQTQKRYIFKKFTLISFKFVMSVIRYWCADTNLIYLKLYKITQFF